MNRTTAPAIAMWLLLAGGLVAQTTDTAPTTAATTSAPAAPVIAEDRSLTPAEYVKLGLPPIEKVWAGPEYAAAVNALTKLAKSDPSRLPRYHSKNSNDVLIRMFAPENLQPLSDKSVPIDKRVSLLLEVAPALPEIMKLYQDASGTGQGSFDSELVEATGFCLRLMVVAPDVAKEYLDGAAPDDEKLPARKEALTKLKSSCADVLFGAVLAMSEKKTYRTTELLRLTVHLQDTIKPLFPDLKDASQEIIRTRLRKTAAAERSSELKRALNDLYEVIRLEE